VPTQKKPDDHTPIQRFRAPKPLWEAYETLCKRAFSQDRGTRLLDLIRADFREHGDAGELAQLDLAEKELEERRARKGGRPRKTPSPAGEPAEEE
jgi:hypothetical protein